jgi:hypothetical protein
LYYFGTINDLIQTNIKYATGAPFRAENLYINNELLTELVVPQNETYIINDNVFSESKSIKKVSVLGNVSFGSSSMDTSAVEQIVVSETCQKLNFGSWSFARCTNLKELDIQGNPQTTFGGNAFKNSGLERLVIPENTTSIACSFPVKAVVWKPVRWDNGSCGFGSKLEEITFGDNVEHIPDEICYGTCVSSITIPNSVTSIGNGAFWLCSRLTSITIPNSVTSIG